MIIIYKVVDQSGTDKKHTIMTLELDRDGDCMYIQAISCSDKT